MTEVVERDHREALRYPVRKQKTDRRDAKHILKLLVEGMCAWLRLGELEAEKTECEPFDRNQFRSVLDKLRTLTRDSNLQKIKKALQDECRKCGVAVCFTTELRHTHVSGAATCYDGRLRPHESTSVRHLVLNGSTHVQKTAGLLYKSVPHQGNSQCSDEEVDSICKLGRVHTTA